MSRPHPARVLELGLVLLGLGLHAAFALLDARLPRDLSLVLVAVPDLAAALRAGELGTVLAAFLEQGGWWQVLVALASLLPLPGGLALQLVFGGALGGALLAAGAVARRLGGAWAGPAAVALCLGTPGLVVQARSGWIHVPEAALVTGCVAVWLADPDLSRRRSQVGLALLGGLALLLRASATGWLGLLALALALHLGRAGWRRLLLPGLAWAVAAIPVLVALEGYLGAKAGARAGYLSAVPPLWPQLLGWLALLPLVAGLLGTALLLLRSPRGTLQRPGARLLLAWGQVPILAYAVSRAGVDNFTPGAVALAVLGGWGLAGEDTPWPRPRRVLGLVTALAAALALGLPQLLPPVKGPLHGVLVGLGVPAGPGLTNQALPWMLWGQRDVDALLAASCPEPLGEADCFVAVDQGLYLPGGEEPGRLELFLADLDHVHLVDLRDRAAGPETPEVHGAMRYDCQGSDGSFTSRFPEARGNLEALAAAQGLEQVWTSWIGGPCSAHWLTPGGAVLRPELLPGSGPREVPAGMGPPQGAGGLYQAPPPQGASPQGPPPGAGPGGEHEGPKGPPPPGGPPVPTGPAPDEGPRSPAPPPPSEEAP